MANIKKYKVGEIENILEDIYNDPETRKTTVPLFMSDSGMGKTYIIEKFMRKKGVYKPPFVLSQRMPFEVSGMAMVEKKNNWIKPLAKIANFFFNKSKAKDSINKFETFLATLNEDSQDRMKY